ncbi:uncharacterized protein [Littorina saxatilis]|uniref:uncharacterized protein n=1 Tax=Littorina saxatilis TaxID=31220 RepID=UPI0038B52245
MMEVEAARVLWGRSVSRHNLRYTVMLSDGDTKTFQELSKIKPYGDQVTIEKEECINHVSKRLGTALRNLVTDCRKKGITLGGRGYGQLTLNTIRKLTIYYNRAIRGGKTVADMKRAVMASLRHGYSTDDKPQHDLCPHGAASWCFYQAALAQNKPPGPHAKLVHTPLNFKKLNPHLEPVYQRLTEDQLLQRCVSGKTQNSNECLHSSVWVRCPKDKFACKNRVRFAVVTGAREFNFGPAAALNTAKFYGFTTGCNMKRLNKARECKRVLGSIRFKKDQLNKRRDTVRAAKLKRQEELIRLEGGAAYAAGQF